MTHQEIARFFITKSAGYAARTVIPPGSTNDMSDSRRPPNYPRSVLDSATYKEVIARPASKKGLITVGVGAPPQHNNDANVPKPPWTWVGQSISGTGGGPAIGGNENDSDRFTGN